MSIVAGVFSRHGRPLAESTCGELQKAVSRNRDHHRIVHRDAFAYLAKVDVGAYGEPAFRIDPHTGTVAMMAGDALLRSGPLVQSRSAELQFLQERLDAGDQGCLDLTTGVFALAHYDTRRSALMLATDKVGLRPFYYWVGDDYVVFATALRILEAVSVVVKRMDLVGVTELTIYPHYQGNDRTAYADIKRQRGGTVITVHGGAVRNELYYDWRTTVRKEDISEQDALVRVHDRFIAAIKRRLKDDHVVPACLSGGLDSRSVVAGLRSLGVEVHTFSYYALPQSQERVFAAQFASAVGTQHTEIKSPVWEGGHSFERDIAAAWSRTLEERGLQPSRPRLLWTGDGGSVGLGHVWVELDQLARVRSGEGDRAMMAVRNNHLTPSVLKPGWARDIAQALLADFREQMAWSGCEPGRAFHLYLILNEQRNDFREHFENLDLHRIEFQSPFYDSDVIASVLPLPVDLCMHHRFYHKWMRLLPHTTEVPWSTYPDHEPCPLPRSRELASQWGEEFASERNRARKSQLVRGGFRALFSGDFPYPFLRADRALAATLLHWAGVRNCASTLGSVMVYHRHWQQCQHKYVALRATAAAPSAASIADHPATDSPEPVVH